MHGKNSSFWDKKYKKTIAIKKHKNKNHWNCEPVSQSFNITTRRVVVEWKTFLEAKVLVVDSFPSKHVLLINEQRKAISGILEREESWKACCHQINNIVTWQSHKNKEWRHAWCKNWHFFPEIKRRLYQRSIHSVKTEISKENRGTVD